MPRLPRLAGVTAVTLALGLLAAAPAPGGGPSVSDPRVIAHLDLAKGQTPENLALEPDGSADLTFFFARRIVNVTRTGAVRTLATLPAVADPHTPIVTAAVVTGIARADDGTLYVNYATGTRRTGIWRLAHDGGAPRQIAELPADGFPNGLALDERRGVLYAADSVLGTVWRVSLKDGTRTAWATGAALDPGTGPGAPGFGANGLRFHHGAVWVSNSDAGTLLRIPVREDGSAGPVRTRATGLTGIDDFGFVERHRDTVLAALFSSGEVVRIAPNGSRAVVLTADDGLSNPTAVAVRGRSAYVTSASHLDQDDPNLLLARVHQRARG